MTFHSDFLIGLGVEITPCGSRVTCDPPPTDTDADYLVLLPPGVTARDRVLRYLSSEGYAQDVGRNYDGRGQDHALDDGFASFRKGEVNLIVTQNADFARRHKEATALCTKLNLMTKPARVAVFQKILYGNNVLDLYELGDYFDQHKFEGFKP